MRGGGLAEEECRLDRVGPSWGEPALAPRRTGSGWKLVIRQRWRTNRIAYGSLYLQISRGVAPRDFAAPQGLTPTLVMTVMRQKPFDAQAALKGARVITTPDIRWKRCDIKTVQLLAGAMGKTEAMNKGAFEAWQVDDQGHVTEGTSSNAWIVTASGELVTRHTDHAILGGITRQTVLKLAAAQGLKYVERSCSVDEAKAASEAFTTSTTAFLRPVVKIDDAPGNQGEVGPFCLKLLELYGQHMEPKV